MGRKGEAGLGGEVRLRNVAYNTGSRGPALIFARVLGEDDMDGGGSAAELGVLDGDCRRARGGPTQELEIESDAVWLLVRRKGGVEVKLRGCEDGTGYDAAVRYAANCPGVVENRGIGAGIDSFHGGCLGEGSHCVRLPASSAVL